MLTCLQWVSALCLVLVFSAHASLGQVQKTTAVSDTSVSARRGLELAKSGHCREAVSVLRISVPRTKDNALKRDAGLAGLHCAMARDQFDAGEEFLRVLMHDFPDDPQVLYAAVHAYSDLATRASQQLATRAGNSPQAHELNAEALEMQGKWDQAEKEYQTILQQDPRLPGIHFRLGRLLLSKPNPPADAAEQAKKHFQQELEIDPSNAGAEYVLGELARQSQQWDEAVLHFTRAAKLDSGLGDAFLGWGASLVSAKKFSDAVTPLETAVKLEPQNPSAHYNLAVAYTRSGRRQDGEREFAIHRSMVQKNPPGEAQPQAEAPQGQSATTPQ
jgi:tetratricopeptide (TPR) repeat protein